VGDRAKIRDGRDVIRRGILKPKSAYNKFSKVEEHARWAIRKRILLKIKAFVKARVKND
jgi:hypothetical protein